MTVTTRNTTYTLTQQGNGWYLFSGHSHYCPVPILGKLDVPSLKVGQPMYFSTINHMGCIVTSPIQEINYDPSLLAF